MKYDFIIIGSGLGGLAAGIILAKENKKVLILEQHTKPGGYLHSFYRKNQRFESGFHFVSALGKNEILSMYWNYLGIMDKIKLVPYDINHFCTLIFPDFRINLGNNLQILKNKLISSFPDETSKINLCLEKISDIKKYFFFFNRDHSGDIDREHESFETSILQFLNSLGLSEKLKSVILAHSFFYGVPPFEAPLGTHSVFFNALYSSTNDIEGGGDALIKALTESLLENGGEIILKKKVSEICIIDEKIHGVQTVDGSYYETLSVISDINPVSSLDLFKHKVFRPAFVQRISDLKNSISHFGGYFISDADLSKYTFDTLYLPATDINSIYENPVSGFPDDFYMYVTIPGARTGITGNKFVIETICPDNYQNYIKWKGTSTGKRPEDYYEFKNKILSLIESKLVSLIPELKGKILYREGSTPLTNHHYTLSPEGSIYGIKHNMDQMRIPVRARTKLENFYFTGQSLIFPGIVGVTITSFVTCSDILGRDYLFSKIDSANQNI
jgi:all-trans-retinol 13,14-reductase